MKTMKKAAAGLTLLALAFADQIQVGHAVSSLIIDSFDDFNASDYNQVKIHQGLGYQNLTTAEHGDRPGENALLIEYQVVHSEAWGGFLSFGRMTNESDSFIDCTGADTIKFDYYIKEKQTEAGRAHLRLTISEGNNCNTTVSDCGFDVQVNEIYYAFNFILDDEPGWKTVTLPFQGDDQPSSTFWRTGWNGIEGNNILDASRLNGFFFEISIDTAGNIGSNSTGAFYLDRLECEGPNVFGAGLVDLLYNVTYEALGDWERNETAFVRHSNGFQNRTLPVLQWDYAVERTEAWGGLYDIHHLPANNMRYSMRYGSHVSFWYNNLVKQNNIGMAQFRLILVEGSDCVKECNIRANNEVYFTFHTILDDEPGWKQVTVELVGDGDPSSPLWRTGWLGIEGNNTFDKDYISGYTLEISLGGMGTRTKGTLLLSDLQVIDPTSGGGVTMDAKECNNAPGLFMVGHYKMIEFAFATCCAKCNADSKCLFFQTNQRDCFLFENPKPANIGLRTFLHSRLENYWVPDVSKVGSACNGTTPLCNCATRGFVDCSGRQLQTVPIFEFPFNETTTSLSLADNPKLVMLLSGHLSELPLDSLDLRGSPIKYLSKEALPTNMSTLDVDVIDSVSVSGRFPGEKQLGNICCERGVPIKSSDPANPVYFCERVVDKDICMDCTIEDFVNYHDESLPLAIVKSTSLFGDGAENPTKCGELCHRTKGCLYFTWDGRESISEPVCYLKTNDNGRQLDEMTSNRLGFEHPGYVSGYVALTRGTIRSEGVHIVEQIGSIAIPEETNNFTTSYHITLTSRPKRGAVWIYPEFRFLDSRNASVTIFPETVVIYADEWDMFHKVTITFDPKLETGGVKGEISNNVDSCDEAFTADPNQAFQLQRTFQVLFPKPFEELNISPAVKTLSLGLGGINATMASLLFLWVFVNRKHPVVRFSQRSFLAMIAFGGIVSSSAVIPFTMDDAEDVLGLARIGEYQPANTACMASIWLYSMGFVITFTPLFAKSWRLSKIVNRKDMKKVTISNAQVFGICAALIVVDACIITAWSVGAPLKFFRSTRSVDEVGNPTESVGLCYSEGDSGPYLYLLIVFHLTILIYGNWICYSVKNLTDTGLSEGKYVQVAMFSNLQVLALAAPLLVIVSDNPISSMFVRSGVIFLNDACTILLIFSPKVLAIIQNTKVGLSTTSGGTKPRMNNKRRSSSMGGNSTQPSDAPSNVPTQT